MKIPQQLLAVCAGSTDLHIRDTDSGTTALCEDRIIPVADGVVNPATALCVPCIGELERRRAARQQVRVLVSLRVAVVARTQVSGGFSLFDKRKNKRCGSWISVSLAQPGIVPGQTAKKY